jgi:hypothetical protein
VEQALSPGRFALVLSILIFATFPQVLLGLQTFVVRDFGFFAYPLAYYQRECFWRGELPLWNPYNNCGVPFLAQWNTMALYPPALIYLLLPLSWSLSFFCLVHQFWAGLGMYFLVRRWTGSLLGAAVGGVMFAFNGLTLNLLMWPSHIATLAWTPWVLVAVERAWREGGRRLVLASLVGALQMMAGGPETILFSWAIVLGLWMTDLVKGRGLFPNDTGPQRATMLWRFPLVVALVAALAAAQLVPFLDLAAHSQRGTGYADTRWSMPGSGWANLLVPTVFERLWPIGVYFQSNQGWTSSYYLGIGGLLLVLLGALYVHERRVWLLSAIACAGVLLAMGDQTFLGRLLRQLIPQLSLVTYPIKFVILLTICAPILAGFGVARLREASEHCSAESAQSGSSQQVLAAAMRRRLVLLAGLLFAVIAGILVWAWRSRVSSTEMAVTLRNGLSRAGLLIIVALLLVVLQRNLKKHWQVALPFALLTILWLDVYTHEPAQNPTAPTWIYQPGLARGRLAMKPQPALGESRAMVSPSAEAGFMGFIVRTAKDNFVVKRLGYFANCDLLDGVPKVNGFFSLYPKECGELNTAIYSATNFDFPHLNDFMCVSQITAPGKFFDWVPRETFLPMVTAGQKPVFLADADALPGLLATNFDATKFVILLPQAESLISVSHQTRAQVFPKRVTAHELQFEAECSEPSMVTISQTYYHRWHAYLDGKRTPLLRANYAFQAVEVPAGRHRVRMAYEDLGLRIGSAISLLALLSCMVLWAVWRRTRPPIPQAASGS